MLVIRGYSFKLPSFAKLVIIGAFLFVRGLDAKVVDKTIATVNGSTILLSEFEKNWEAYETQQKKLLPPQTMDSDWVKENKAQLLDLMIEQKLLLNEAKRRKINVNKRDMERGIESVKERFRSDDRGQTRSEKEVDKAFREELDREGLSQKEFEEKIREQLLILQLRESEILARTDRPKEDDVKALYDKLMLRMDGKKIPGLTREEEEILDTIVRFFKAQSGERVRARHILIRTDPSASFKEKSAARKRINDIKKKITAGEDFEELARKHSEDVGSAQQGGDLGEFVRGQMVEPFEKVAFKLSVGSVSDVVETEFGYHIIKVEGKMAPQKIRYETVKNDLEQHLFQMKAQERYEEWITTIKKKAVIDIAADFHTKSSQSN